MESVINVRKDYRMINKFKNKYEKDLVAKNKGGVFVENKEINELKSNLDKQRIEMEEKLNKSVNEIITNLEKTVKTDEERKEVDKIKEILSKKDVQD